MAISRKWQAYVQSALQTSWQPAALIPATPNTEAIDDNIIEWCVIGQQNEADSINLFQAAAQVATSEAWLVFAPLWLQDELRHSEMFHRLGAYLGLPDRWIDSLLPSEAVRQDRQDFYAKLFRSELHVWAALALDEWNTQREYLEDGVKDFERFGLSQIFQLLGRDESRHHAFALFALKELGDRQTAIQALEEVVEIAAEMDSFSHFLFDQWEVDNVKRGTDQAFNAVVHALSSGRQ